MGEEEFHSVRQREMLSPLLGRSNSMHRYILGVTDLKAVLLRRSCSPGGH